MIKEVDVKELIIFDVKENSNPFTKYVAYFLHDKMIGYLGFDHLYEKLDIVDIYVEEAYRNQKVGSVLIEYLIDYGKRKACINITLEVKETNAYAIKLYEKYGFHKNAVRKGYYQGIDGILMELIL